MQLHGRNAGYIVVNPEKPNKFWDPGVDHANIVDFLRQAIAAFQPNQRKVHVTGFSQGGFASWRILDLASDVVCSIAPLASSGRDRWGDSYVRNPSSFATGRRGPPTPRSIMYHHGTSDGLSPFSNFNPQVRRKRCFIYMVTICSSGALLCMHCSQSRPHRPRWLAAHPPDDVPLPIL